MNVDARFREPVAYSDTFTAGDHLAVILDDRHVSQEILNHFGSFVALSRASFCELRMFLSREQAHRLVAAFRLVSSFVNEEAATQALDSPEAIYRLVGGQLQRRDREVLMAVLLNTKYHLIKTEEISVGTLNESLAHPREIFKPAVVHSAHAMVLVHNHPSGDPSPSEADLRLTCRLSEAARLLQINLLDHVIVGTAGNKQPYFSFREAGILA